MSTDMILVFLILLVFVLLILTILIFLWHSGLFLQLDIRAAPPPFKELEVAYKFVRGSCKDCGPLFTEAHALVPRLRCIGVYYDDPAEVEDNNVRYIVGLILNDKDNEANEDEKQKLQAKGFQTTTFPSVEHVVCTAFPHRNFASILIAVHRVIPKMREYIKEMKLQAYPLIEIYGGKDIVYAAPLSRQSEFFVYEALAESEEDLTSDQKMEATDETSMKDLEELPDTVSSVNSAMESGSKVEEIPSSEVLDSLEDNNKGASNGSEASTESFEELQLDS